MVQGVGFLKWCKEKIHPVLVGPFRRTFEVKLVRWATSIIVSHLLSSSLQFTQATPAREPHPFTRAHQLLHAQYSYSYSYCLAIKLHIWPVCVFYPHAFTCSIPPSVYELEPVTVNSPAQCICDTCFTTFFFLPKSLCSLWYNKARFLFHDYQP